MKGSLNFACINPEWLHEIRVWIVNQSWERSWLPDGALLIQKLERCAAPFSQTPDRTVWQSSNKKWYDYSLLLHNKKSTVEAA